MVKRAWKLPDIQELSKEQERARLLPREGCHLIVGGPGTGKSVLTLLRSRRHHRPNGAQDYVFLVYNKLLLKASQELVSGAVNAITWITWFKGVYSQMLSRACPVKNGNAYEIDWEQVKTGIDASSNEIAPPLTPFVIIDEGQDMPPDFYHALAQLGFENFYVVADQNQQITNENSSLRDIENELAIDTKNRIELTENYRNCDRVARLALQFCVEDAAVPAVNMPSARPCARTPVIVEYGAECRWDFASVIRRLLKFADRDPDKLIGIITPNNKSRQRWLAALTQDTVALDNGHPRIVTYAKGEPDGEHRFSEGGIFVINAQSVKGLEFDCVFLADINEYPCHLEDRVWMDAKKRLFYVMVSRARELVVLLRQSGRDCPIEAILPKDENILRRWS